MVRYVPLIKVQNCEILHSLKIIISRKGFLSFHVFRAFSNLIALKI